ncbi:trehalose-6-phosphate synthase [Parapedobacter soli]|uniref:trehalose-6-phosphate synthase n=1 Tax=Parapedobacter soli TaxID=416955 RepID=UPI0021C98BB9|nr:trehalose-6-phosphate synthase [Parapedobacter soli]
MLVISEFAGASVELPHAIRTNPYDGQSLKDGLQNALVLDVTEKETPHAAAV